MQRFLTQPVELQSNPVLSEMLKDSLELFSLYKGQDMPLARSISAPKPSGKLNIPLQAAQEEVLQKSHFCTLAALVRQEMPASLLDDEEAPFPRVGFLLPAQKMGSLSMTVKAV